MKKILLFVVLVMPLVLQAKIWRVNNNAGVVADFTTAQAAHDAASANDTIMLEPSSTTYGVINIIKKLVIIGAGYNVTNLYPETPINKNTLVGNINFGSGSSGSTVMGLSPGVGGGALNLSTVNNITIQGTNGCSVNLAGACANIVITKNWNISIDAYQTPGTPSTNAIISNNQIWSLNIDSYNLGFAVTNNVILGPLTCKSQIFSNNIYVYSVVAVLTSSTLSNNIDASLPGATNFGTTNGNVGNVSPTAVFVAGTISANTFSVAKDTDLVLKATSPAKGAGIGGIDCGMYGGPNPYVPGGLPPIPLITKFTSTGIGSSTTPVQIKVSVKSNN